MTKICSHCTTPKELSDFAKSSSHSHGVQSWCRACTKDHQKGWYQENKEHVQQRGKRYQKEHKEHGTCHAHCGRPSLPNKGLCQTCAEKQVWCKTKLKYGLDKQAWEHLLESQGGVCALCKEPGVIPGTAKKGPETFAVDHCHTTGKVRGIIHARCNSGIGYLRDDLKTVKMAVRYLEVSLPK